MEIKAPIWLALIAALLGCAANDEAVQAKSGLEMVAVAGGRFVMGGADVADDGGPPGARLADECPHEVNVPAFSMGKYEITQADWVKIMGAIPSGLVRCDDCPVSRISWHEVQDFIQRLNLRSGKRYRLPTEEEWEFAARGGVRDHAYTYAGSDRAEEVAWFAGNSGGVSHPVGMLAPNELGLYDMSGNIWEWTNTNKAPYSCDPAGKVFEIAVLRGGTYANRVSSVRVRDRNGRDRDMRLDTLGFRLAQS